MLDCGDYVLAALVEEGVITGELLDRASATASRDGQPVIESLVAMGAITHRDVAVMRATISEYPFVDIAAYEIVIGNTGLLPRSLAERHLAFPLFQMGDMVTVGMADPLDLRAVDQIRAALRCDIEPVLCEPNGLRSLIERSYSLAGDRKGDEQAEAGTGSLTSGEEPIVAAVNHILNSAVEAGASDIHISPDERELSLRYRVDGALQVRQGPSLEAHSGLVQRIKVMANMDLTQSRRPQDGKIRIEHNGRPVDLRVSVLPTVTGENVVIRILASAATIKGFAELGFPARELAQFEEMILQPYGMILVTGPTGSGKTTTLYTALSRLNTEDRNLMTIEDPVETRLARIRQVQVNTEIGMTFAGTLRSILRQDPDVVLVGEIRDDETAKIATQAALTGHLVLSTLHTNDAPGAIPRLVDLGCPGFAINAALLGVIAQRLVRNVCSECAAPDVPDDSVVRRFDLSPDDLDRYVAGRGCAKCSSTGYRGRSGVFEFLEMTPGLREVVDEGALPSRIQRQALKDGMRPMWMDGLDRARIGITTLEEVLRVAMVGPVDEEESESLRMSA